MNKLLYLIFSLNALAIVCFFTGCHPGYKATDTTRQVERKLCAEEWLSFPDQPHPMFEELPGAVKDIPAGFVLPAKYTRYKVNSDTLKALFAYLKTTGKKGGLVIPVAQHCEPFSIAVSGTMISALQDKYPELISLKGIGTLNKASEARIDWNGSQMRAQVGVNEAMYFITPLSENGTTTYLVYNREDSGETKQPFEQTPARQNKVYYDR